MTNYSPENSSDRLIISWDSDEGRVCRSIAGATAAALSGIALNAQSAKAQSVTYENGLCKLVNYDPGQQKYISIKEKKTDQASCSFDSFDDQSNVPQAPAQADSQVQPVLDQPVAQPVQAPLLGRVDVVPGQALTEVSYEAVAGATSMLSTVVGIGAIISAFWILPWMWRRRND